MNNGAQMWWLFLVAVLAIISSYTTDLNASGFDATEIARHMIEKSPYFGSFDRWDYANYCAGSDWWDMTSTQRMEIQCKIDELTSMYNDTDTRTSCECPPPDIYDGKMGLDLLYRLC